MSDSLKHSVPLYFKPVMLRDEDNNPVEYLELQVCYPLTGRLSLCLCVCVCVCVCISPPSVSHLSLKLTTCCVCVCCFRSRLLLGAFSTVQDLLCLFDDPSVMDVKMVCATDTHASFLLLLFVPSPACVVIRASTPTACGFNNVCVCLCLFACVCVPVCVPVCVHLNNTGREDLSGSGGDKDEAKNGAVVCSSSLLCLLPLTCTCTCTCTLVLIVRSSLSSPPPPPLTPVVARDACAYTGSPEEDDKARSKRAYGRGKGAWHHKSKVTQHPSSLYSSLSFSLSLSLSLCLVCAYSISLRSPVAA